MDGPIIHEGEPEGEHWKDLGLGKMQWWIQFWTVNLGYMKYLQECESESRSVVSDSLWSHGLYSPWTSLGQNTGVGSLSLFQGIFPNKGSNPGLPHYRQILYQLSHEGTDLSFFHDLITPQDKWWSVLHFFMYFFKNWDIVALQCHASLCCTYNEVNQRCVSMYPGPLSHSSQPSRSPQSTEMSSLRYPSASH